MDLHLPPIITKSISSFIIPFLILLGVVIASAAQTEAAYYITTIQGYDKPYLTFYITHSTLSLFFPIHLLILRLTNPQIPTSSYLTSLYSLTASQLGYDNFPPKTGISLDKRVIRAWIIRVSWLTVLLSIPALCWFVSMLYTTAMDVTSIYASSSFHTYFFSMLFLKMPLSRLTIGSICLAFVGVLVITFAGSGDNQETGEGPKDRVLGDVIMMIGAVVLALYEVVYKLVLPEGHGGSVKPQRASLNGYSQLPVTGLDGPHSIPTPSESRPLTPNITDDNDLRGNLYTSPRAPTMAIPLSPTSLRQPSTTRLIAAELNDESSDNNYLSRSTSEISNTHVQLPPALHANFLTTCIGLATLLYFWVLILALHYTGIETFRWPGSAGVDGNDASGRSVWLGLSVVAWGGASYNAGLMILIGIWGPTTSSVANLLTIGLVAVVDALWLGQIPSFQTLVGVGMICTGFGILLWEGEG